jgi:prepilin peptidase CpaA
MHMPHLSATTAMLLAYLLAVAVADLLSHRIPNRLTVPAAAIALAFNIIAAGGAGALASIGGLFVGLAAFLPFYLARGFGAGDVKAMAAAGAFLGPHGAMLAVACTLLVGAACALVVLAVVGGPTAVRALAARHLVRAGTLVEPGRDLPQVAPPGGAQVRFPYGFAIACGTLASLAWS